MTDGGHQGAGGEGPRQEAPAPDATAGETTAPEPEAAPPQDAQPDAPAQAPPPESGDRPVHLYDAVATQRDQVLDAYGAQRAAVLQAVTEQREAATAPIHAVRQRQAAQGVDPAAVRPADLRATGTAPGAASLAPHRPYPSTAEARRQLVAADIVATLKALIAEEVRVQVCALSSAAAEGAAEESVPERHN